MTQKELIQTFYRSFANGDAKTMTSCYHDDVVFEDPAFGVLKGRRAKAMWEMLLKRSKGDLKIEFSDVTADDERGKAIWIARYPYGPNKRRVVNKIKAEFTFKDGKIIHHKDHFDLWKWSRQALGLSGYLLGWSSFFKSKIQQKTNLLLEKYMRSNH